MATEIFECKTLILLLNILKKLAGKLFFYLQDLKMMSIEKSCV